MTTDLEAALSAWFERTPKMTYEECSKHGAFRAGYAARDAEVKVLREAVRRQVLRTNGAEKWCRLCGGTRANGLVKWHLGERERHAPGCLAAPTDSQAEGGNG